MRVLYRQKNRILIVVLWCISFSSIVINYLFVFVLFWTMTIEEQEIIFILPLRLDIPRHAMMFEQSAGKSSYSLY